MSPCVISFPWKVWRVTGRLHSGESARGATTDRPAVYRRYVTVGSQAVVFSRGLLGRCLD
jgi:hypothetical protein